MKDKNTFAAIIGYYRMGATMEEMCAATGLHHIVIKRIISQFNRTGSGNRL